MKSTEKSRTNPPESNSTYSQVGAESNVNMQPSSMGLTGRISIGSIRLLRSMPEYYSTDGYRRHERHICTRVRKERLWFSFFILFYFGYLIIGAVTMHIIEVPIEKAKRRDFFEVRNNFLEMYPQVLDNDLEDFLAAVLQANSDGISPLRNASQNLNWNFGQAILFTTSVVTTIGYGRVKPLSDGGKIFCIIFASIGIPLTLVLTSATVEKLLPLANRLLCALNNKFDGTLGPVYVRVLLLTIIASVVIVCCFVIPSIIFTYLQPSWTSLDAFYFCFISLTTIGFGDFVPDETIGDDPNVFVLYEMVVCVYLLLSLITMMFVLTIFYDIPQMNLTHLLTEGEYSEPVERHLTGRSTTFEDSRAYHSSTTSSSRSRQPRVRIAEGSTTSEKTLMDE
uniref:Potassium channel domain-containing protein n=1 Tax=Glossina pallidipes TaxID=7398 RepID=A0A1B0AE93_GLOPL